MRAESDARTLMDAGKILCDKERMKKAQNCMKDMKRSINSIQDTKDFFQDKYGHNGDETLEVEKK